MIKDFCEIKNEWRPLVRYWIPQALPNENDLRKDIQDLSKRGFGGLEIVPMHHLQNQTDLDPKYWWGSQRWLNNLSFILDEAQNQNMTVDLAISLQWPISLPGVKHADEKTTLYELSYGFKIIENSNGYIKLPQPRVKRDEGTKRLLALSSYEFNKKNELIFDSYVDLSNFIDNGNVYYEFPNDSKRIIFAFWEQPANQKINNYFYVIDHYSKIATDELITNFEQTVLPILKKYPTTFKSIFCDSLEFDVAQDWSRNFDKEFLIRRKYDLKRYLPAIDVYQTYPKNDSPSYKFDKCEINKQFNDDYCLTLSEMFNENHLSILKKKLEHHNISLRYQVAYNKPLEIETAAAEVSIPENETLNRQSFDSMKTMAGAVHLADKKIYSYETNAEFGNAYGQTYEDINWWIKRGWVSSVNQQVLHGAVYNGTFEGYVWPGYESMGKYVSNYWNRTFSVASSKSSLDYISRVNRIARQLVKVDLAFLKNSFINEGKGSDGHHIVKDDMLLMNNGYTYDIVSSNLLNKVSITVQNGLMNDQNGPGYKAIITEDRYLKQKDLDILFELAEKGLPIFILMTNKIEQKQKNIYPNIHYVTNYTEILTMMERLNIEPSIRFEKPVDIAALHTKDKTSDYYVLYNYNRVRIKESDGKMKYDPETSFPNINRGNLIDKEVTIIVPEEKHVYQLNPINGEVRLINIDDNKVTVTIPKNDILILSFSNIYDASLHQEESNEKAERQIIEKKKLKEHFYELNILSTATSFFDYSIEPTLLREKKYVPKKTYNFDFKCSEEIKELEIKFLFQGDNCEIIMNEETYYPSPSNEINLRVKKQHVKETNIITINIFDNLKTFFDEKASKTGIVSDIEIIKYY